MGFVSSLVAQIPTTPDEAMTWVRVVKDSGFVGVSIVLAIANVLQYRQSRADRDEVIKMLTDQNAALKALKGG